MRAWWHTMTTDRDPRLGAVLTEHAVVVSLLFLLAAALGLAYVLLGGSLPLGGYLDTGALLS